MAISPWSFYHFMCKSHGSYTKSRPYRRTQGKVSRGEVDLETRAHILTECPRFTKDRVTLPRPCLGDLIKFLTSNPTAFAFTVPREPP